MCFQCGSIGHETREMIRRGKEEISLFVFVFKLGFRCLDLAVLELALVGQHGLKLTEVRPASLSLMVRLKRCTIITRQRGSS